MLLSIANMLAILPAAPNGPAWRRSLMLEKCPLQLMCIRAGL
jgi:hypothetical protein